MANPWRRAWLIADSVLAAAALGALFSDEIKKIKVFPDDEILWSIHVFKSKTLTFYVKP